MEVPMPFRQDERARNSSYSTSATIPDLSAGQNKLDHVLENTQVERQIPAIEISPRTVNEKNSQTVAGIDLEATSGKPADGTEVLETVEDIVTTVIHVDDDATLNPWTFRMFFIGLGLSAFGAVLQEIFYFKPQVIFVSSMFLTVISYALGEFLAHTIPRWGRIGRFLNPGPFNAKEHTATVMMASAASVSALSTEALAVQKLFYGAYPSQVAGVFVTLSSQLIGYGIAGMLRRTLLWPVKMFYPGNLPITTVLETLHREKDENKRRIRIFWIVFTCLLVWELVPEYMFPLLVGVSVFCLAKQDNLFFTNLFGGAQGNEGVGFLSICFDWNYIASFGSPLFLPLQTLVSCFIGSIGCTILLMGLYYGNVWRSQDFPFLSQFLFDGSSNSTNYITYNLTSIFSSEFMVDDAAVDAQGIPWMTSSYIAYLITSNAGMTATIVHMLLWNYDDIKVGWAFINKENVRRLLTPSSYVFWKYGGTRSEEEKEAIRMDPTVDPHYKVMVNYTEVPNSWYFICFLVSFITAIISLYDMRSTLPWWGLVIGILMLSASTLFFGAQYAITGFGFNLQPIFQMLAGYMFPGRPLANMYFTTFTFGGFVQGIFLLRDLKLAQQNKLSPRCAFTTQVIGCLFGACLNYITMITIVQNQADVLLSIEGTSIWSGADIQQFNTLAIAWSIAPKMFSIGARYEWVTIAYFIGFLAPLPFYFMHWYSPDQPIWSYLNSAIILWFMGDLSTGINSSTWTFYVIGFTAQFFVRKYRPQYFVKWNYLLSAALDGGTQVCVFLLTFAVQGGSGAARPFPTWWGNKPDNVDRCMYNFANDG